MKSYSKENYVKAIHQLQQDHPGEWISTSSLAAHLRITNPSVTGMLKRLAATVPPLVIYEPYMGVKLAQAGEKMALEVIRHHRLIESYLNKMLGYSWDLVHEEAERLEHVISEEMEERMAAALGHPASDPHGDPIPDRDGNYYEPDYIELTNLADGETGHIRRVTGQEPDLLRYLESLGLVPETRVKVLAKAPFNGPVSISLEDRPDTPLNISREVTDKIMVLPETLAGKE